MATHVLYKRGQQSRANDVHKGDNRMTGSYMSASTMCQKSVSDRSSSEVNPFSKKAPKSHTHILKWNVKEKNE